MTNDERVQRLLALDEKLLIAAEKAADRLIEKLDDPKTPSAALSNLIVTALRSNGKLDAKREDDRPIEPHEMTADQLQQNITRLRLETAARAKPVIDGSVARIEDRSARSSVFE